MTKAPLTGFTFYLLLFALGMAAFIEGLDFSIANVAIPAISATFGVSAQQGTWVITLFAVSTALSLCLTGYLATRFGAVKVLLWSIYLFTLASLFCGLAWNFSSLIIFRIMQGFAAGPLMTLPQGLIAINCAKEKRGMALGILVLIMVLAPVLGPFVGGLITENYGWPWIFYINVPFGILSGVLIWGLLHDRETTIEKIPIDKIGVILLAIGIGTLQVVLDKGNDADWFGSTEIIILSIISGLGIYFFVIWNCYSKYPILDFSFFKDTNFTLGTLLTTVPYLVIGGTTILLPLWLQTQKGYTPFWSGVAVMPLGVLPIILAPLLTLIIPYTGQRLITTIGYVVFVVTCFWFSNFTSEISLSQILWPRLVQGAAIALCFLPLFQITISNIRDEDINRATGVHNSIRMILGGSGISTALYITAWQRRENLHHSNLTEVLHPLHTPTLEAYHILSSVGVDDQTAAEIFDILVTKQAYVMGFNDLLWLSGWILLLLIPIIWFCKEPPKEKTVATSE